MKRKGGYIIAALLCAALVLPLFSGGGAGVAVPSDRFGALPVYAGKGGVPISALAAALYEPESGRLLYSFNCDAVLPMASTTKIMTAAVALEYGDPKAETTVTGEAARVRGSSVYLTEGERFTQKELLYCTLLESGNDAATALAIAVAGDVESFVALMNEKAAALGLRDTHFANPHGLDADGHRTTAKELAVITAYALTFEDFRQAVSTVSAKLDGKGHLPRFLVNHNRLLRSCEGLIGVKNGYTSAAGRCLVTAAHRNGMTLIAVTLNDRDDWRDHVSLLDYGFSAFRMETVCTESERAAVPVRGGRKVSALAACKGEMRVCTPTDSEIKRLFVTGFVAAPIAKGQPIAKLKVFENGTLIKEAPLFAIEGVPSRKRRPH